MSAVSPRAKFKGESPKMSERKCNGSIRMKYGLQRAKIYYCDRSKTCPAAFQAAGHRSQFCDVISIRSNRRNRSNPLFAGLPAGTTGAARLALAHLARLLAGLALLGSTLA
jgi:hypothetical protein